MMRERGLSLVDEPSMFESDEHQGTSFSATLNVLASPRGQEPDGEIQVEGPEGEDMPVGAKTGWVIKGLAGSLSCNVLLLLVCIGLGMQLSASGWAVLFGVPAAFQLAYANGANDCANSVGTAVGAGAMSMRTALLAGSACEFLGALTIGPWVAKSIAGGQLHVERFDEDPNMFSLVMLSALLGSGLTTLLATVYGYPISATHGVVSGLIAVSLVSGVDGAVNWGGLGYCLVGWVASPVAGMLAGGLVSHIVHKLIISSPDPGLAARRHQPVMLAATVSIVLLFLLLKGPGYMRVKPAWLAFLLSIIGGVLLALLLKLVNKIRGGSDSETTEEQVQQVQQSATAVKTEPLDEDDGENGSFGPDSEAAAADEQFDAVQKPFVPLLIVAGLTVAFAHGGNDVGNSVGPLAVIINIDKLGAIETTPTLPFWTLLLGALAFVLGILSLGSRTVSTVGSKIADLTPSRSFNTQIGAAIAVLGSSVASLPVSTSHCLVGSVIGVSLTESYNGVQDAKLDFGVLKKIIIGWCVTIPLAAGVAVAVMLPLKSFF